MNNKELIQIYLNSLLVNDMDKEDFINLIENMIDEYENKLDRKEEEFRFIKSRLLKYIEDIKL